MMVDVMFDLPLVPVQMTVNGLHGIATTDHEGMSAIDVVGSVDVLADLLRRSATSVEVLSAQVGQSPVVG